MADNFLRWLMGMVHFTLCLNILCSLKGKDVLSVELGNKSVQEKKLTNV